MKGKSVEKGKDIRATLLVGGRKTRNQVAGVALDLLKISVDDRAIWSSYMGIKAPSAVQECAEVLH